MKWPMQLVIVRHGESAYNVLRHKKDDDPEFTEFKKAYNRDYRSNESKRLATLIKQKYASNTGDALTPITNAGHRMSLNTGAELRNFFSTLPDVILVSPYLRAIQTLDGIKAGWPELANVKVIYEDRIREQEHGLSVVYNDWRVFHVMHPEQKELRDIQGPYWYQYPQGESVSQVRERIRSFLGTLVREYSGLRVMLITHHLTLLSIRANLERLSPEQFMDLDENSKPVNCGVTIYEGKSDRGKNGRLELTYYNLKMY